MPFHLFFLSSSMTPALEMCSGTAQSIPWWPIFLTWWPAGLLSVMCGTCHQWSKRYLRFHVLQMLIKHCLGESLHYCAWRVAITFVNLYWQLNGQRSESNTVTSKLIEHGFMLVSYLQVKNTLAEVQTFLRDVPCCSQTASLLGCRCLAFLWSRRLEEMLKCGFMLQGSCLSAWHWPPFFTPEGIYRFSPSLHSILGCFCLLCPPLPPSAQLPPTSLFLSPAEYPSNPLPGSFTPQPGTASQPWILTWRWQSGQGLCSSNAPVWYCLPQSLLSPSLGREAAVVCVSLVLCSSGSLLWTHNNSLILITPGPNPAQGTPSPPRWSCQCVPSLRLILKYWEQMHPLLWPDLWPHAASCLRLPQKPQSFFLALNGGKPGGIPQDQLELPCRSHLACGPGINPSACCLTKSTSLSETWRKCLSCKANHSYIFFRKRKMLFTLPTESRLSLLLGDECLCFLGEKRLWGWV